MSEDMICNFVLAEAREMKMGPTAEPTVGLANALESGLEGVRGGEHQMAESDRRTICRRGSRGGVPHVGDPYDAGLLPDFFRVTPSLGSALSQAT